MFSQLTCWTDSVSYIPAFWQDLLFSNMYTYSSLRFLICRSVWFQGQCPTAVVAPGPKIFLGPEAKSIWISDKPRQLVQLDLSVSLEKALILCAELYYIKKLTYPAAYSQLLGLIQLNVLDDPDFPRSWRRPALVSLLKRLNTRGQHLKGAFPLCDGASPPLWVGYHTWTFYPFIE